MSSSNSKNVIRALLLAAAVGIAGSAHAAVKQDNVYNAGGSQTDFHQVPVVSNDLIDQNHPSTFLQKDPDVGFSGGNCCGGTSTTNALNDGSPGTASSTADTTFDADGGSWTSTFRLNLTTNPQGYDITGINSYSGWPDIRTSQKYTVLFSKKDTPNTFQPLTGSPFSILPSGAGSAIISITEDQTGVLASNVAAVQFQFESPGNNRDTVYREIDVIGAPSAVPEPASLSILGLAAVGMLGWRRRA